MVAAVADAKARTQGMKPGGRTLWFYRGDGARKPTAYLDLHAYHDLPQRRAVGYAHAISIHSLGKLARRFASPDGS